MVRVKYWSERHGKWIEYERSKPVSVLTGKKSSAAKRRLPKPLLVKPKECPPKIAPLSNVRMESAAKRRLSAEPRQTITVPSKSANTAKRKERELPETQRCDALIDATKYPYLAQALARKVQSESQFSRAATTKNRSKERKPNCTYARETEHHGPMAEVAAAATATAAVKIVSETEQCAFSSLDPTWRLGIARVRRGEDFKNLYAHQGCSLTSLFHNDDTLRVLGEYEKMTGSMTIIVLGRLRTPRALENSDERRQFEASKRDMALKISVEDLGDPTAFDTEIYIYNRLADLVSAHVAPNLIVSPAHWECTLPVLLANTEEPARSKFTRALQSYHYYYKYNPTANKKVRMLLLEGARGKTLGQYIAACNDNNDEGKLFKDETQEERGSDDGNDSDENDPTPKAECLSEAEFWSVVFQTLYTLHVLTERGVRHGDLHLGNIFIEKMPLEQCNAAPMAYFPDPPLVHTNGSAPTASGPTEPSVVFYELPSTAVAKIYDWDLGGIYPLSDAERQSRQGRESDVKNFPLMLRFNEELRPGNALPPQNMYAQSKCKSRSSCGRNAKADAYTFISSLYESAEVEQKYPEFAKFAERVVKKRLLKYGAPLGEFSGLGGEQFHLCSGPFQSNGNDFCNGPWEPPDNVMLSPAEMLKDAVFERFRRRWPQQRPQTTLIYGDWASEQQRTDVFRRSNTRAASR